MGDERDIDRVYNCAIIKINNKNYKVRFAEVGNGFNLGSIETRNIFFKWKPVIHPFRTNLPEELIEKINKGEYDLC